jgi:hypothetical protein
MCIPLRRTLRWTITDYLVRSDEAGVNGISPLRFRQQVYEDPKA